MPVDAPGTSERWSWIPALIGAAAVVAAVAVAAHHVAVGVKPPPYEPVSRTTSTLMPWDIVGEFSDRHGPDLPYTVKTGEIRPGGTLGGALQALGMNVVFVDNLSLMMQRVVSLSKCRPGNSFELRLDENGDLMRFEYRVSPIEIYVAERGDDGRFASYKEEFEEETKVFWVKGRIESSLYESVVAAGEDPELAVKVANEVFAWDIDFYSDVQRGDIFKIAVEKTFSGDYFVKYGRIVAAEYSGAVGRKQAFLWHDPTGREGYFNAKGVATRRAFLRSPLKFAHVTSPFGKRLHPMLKVFRPHHGVDYGAPIGTPVWAVADGTVVSAGWDGGLGKAVRIRHSGGYTSIYGHLSKIGPGLHAGKRVRQGQTVGNVGSTGLSTGPHLHFALLQGAKYINPLKRVAPPTEPIPAKYAKAFEAAIRPWAAEMETVEIGMRE